MSSTCRCFIGPSPAGDRRSSRGSCASARARGAASSRRCARGLREAPQTVAASLARYEPELLGVYRQGEALVLVAARISRAPAQWRMAARAAARAPLNAALATTRVFFGSETIEYRTPTDPLRRHARASRNIPRPRWSACTTAALGALRFVLTQSFTFLTKATGQGLCSASQPHGERRRFRGLPGRGTEGCAGCA